MLTGEADPVAAALTAAADELEKEGAEGDVVAEVGWKRVH